MQKTSNAAPAIALQSDATALLAEQRTDRTQLRLTDRTLSVFALTDRPPERSQNRPSLLFHR